MTTARAANKLERSEPRPCRFRGHDGLGLVGDVRGDDDGDTVLLLHGGGQTRHAWGGAADALADAGCRAISLDQRGHGDSQWAPDGNYGVSTYARDLSAVLAQIGRPTAVVGASLGGLAAMMSQGRFRDGGATALVFVDVTHRLQPAGVERIVEFMRAKPDGFASLEEAADLVAGYLTHRPRPKDTKGLEKNLRLGEDGRYRWHWDPMFLERGPGAEFKTREDYLSSMRDAVSALSVPILLVRGALSDIVSEEAAQEFLRLAPHAEFVDVGGAAHMVAGDRNDAFTGAVVDFLLQSRGAAGS